MKKVLILCGGPSSEHEVSISTAQSILNYIDYKRYLVSLCIVDKKKRFSFTKILEPLSINSIKNKPISLDSGIKKLKQYNLVLLATHGQFGEDGVIQTYLEENNVKFTGSDSYSSRLCMDKYRSCTLVNKYLKLPEVKTKLIKLKDLESILRNSKLPLFVKPNRDGSSVCAYPLKDNNDVKNSLKDFDKYKDNGGGILVQELIEDYVEVSCGCLEKKNGTFISLPPIEIIPQKATFFDYKSKYDIGGSIERIPAVGIPKKQRDQVSKLAIEIHKLLGCRLYSRSDFLIKGSDIYFLETNTLPGMTATSLIPQEAKAIGMNFTKLITFFIENA
jgi:D-alanine-D-alanine ligase